MIPVEDRSTGITVCKCTWFLCPFVSFLHELDHLMMIYVRLGLNTMHCICVTFLNISVAEYCYMVQNSLSHR
jgi:hypothetical protein